MPGQSGKALRDRKGLSAGVLREVIVVVEFRRLSANRFVRLDGYQPPVLDARFELVGLSAFPYQFVALGLSL